CAEGSIGKGEHERKRVGFVGMIGDPDIKIGDRQRATLIIMSNDRRPETHGNVTSKWLIRRPTKWIERSIATVSWRESMPSRKNCTEWMRGGKRANRCCRSGKLLAHMKSCLRENALLVESIPKLPWAKCSRLI